MGVSDVLAGRSTLGEVLQEGKRTGFSFVPAGRPVPDPMALIESGLMQAMIDDLRRRADLVLLDSPPLLAVADGLALAALSDAVLMVCVPGESHRQDLELARRMLSRIGENICGVVLNKMQRSSSYGYRYRQYYGDQVEPNDGAPA
jgi:Mrp family chromosome partitioning ATPase